MGQTFARTPAIYSDYRVTLQGDNVENVVQNDAITQIYAYNQFSIFAKLLPTKIAESNWSGFFNNSKERFALFFDFFDRFFNLILFAAIIPVSEPEKNPLSISKKIKTINKVKREGSSSIINL